MTTTIDVPDQAKLTASLLNNLALAAVRDSADALATALAMLRRAIALNPLDLGHRLNLATYLVESGEDAEAEELLTFVLKHSETADIAWQIMGVINTNRGRLDEALACFKRAHDLQPQHGQHRFDLAAAYLRAGQWLEGWPLYEHRRDILPKCGPTPDAPTWTGEKTGHLAIWPDQGHGDVIMFSRFVPWAKERADTVSFLVTPQTLGLFAGFTAAPGIEVTHAYDPKTKYDHQICIASLPQVYGLTPENVPPDPGLISPAPSVGSLAGPGLKIGIAWQGNAQFPGDRMRSIPFREYLPLAADPRNEIYSLQVGPAAAEIAKARAQRVVHDMSGMIDGEWTHAAATIKQLDLVVSSCTAIAHLAGALGVPSFVMIPQFADWRWLSGRDDTPWYPQTRLFRQTRAGRWADVVQRVVQAINELHIRRSVAAMLGRRGMLAPVPAVASAAAAAEYEPEVRGAMRRLLRPGDCFVDVGANEGLHTRYGAQLVGEEGKVIAFEPGQALDTLCEAVNGLPQVEVIARPCWHAVEPIEFHHCAEGSGGDAVWDPAEFPTNEKSRERGPKSVTLPATTLDRELGERGLAPRLIKIDTEGAELAVLRGAVELLLSEQRPPFIIAELHEFGLAKLGGSQMALRDYMREAGYETFVIFPNDKKPARVDPERKIESRYILNLLFAREADIEAAWNDKAMGDPMRDGLRVYASAA